MLVVKQQIYSSVGCDRYDCPNVPRVIRWIIVVRRCETRSAVAVAVVDAPAADVLDAVAIDHDIGHLLALVAAAAVAVAVAVAVAADDISASKPSDVDTTFADYRRETID